MPDVKIKHFGKIMQIRHASQTSLKKKHQMFNLSLRHWEIAITQQVKMHLNL